MKLTHDFIRSFILNAKKEKEQAEQLLKHQIEVMSIAVSNNFSFIEQFFRYSLPGMQFPQLNTYDPIVPNIFPDYNLHSSKILQGEKECQCIANTLLHLLYRILIQSRIHI